MAGGWILELDISKFFDTIQRPLLTKVLSQRVRDGVILRLVAKWLHAGVMEDGAVTYPKAGTPQGGVISPILANIFLHEVLDTWFEREVKPRLRGKTHLFRYADDAVMVFEREEDARKVPEVLPKRFGKYGLTLHPDKTRLVPFRRPDRMGGGGSGPGTFDFLGFTYHWAQLPNGHWVVLRRTTRGRFRRALKAMSDWMKENRHRPLGEQQLGIAQRLRGHYGYYAIRGNTTRAWVFLHYVQSAWKRVAGATKRTRARRSGWRRMKQILEQLLLPGRASRASYIAIAAKVPDMKSRMR